MDTLNSIKENLKNLISRSDIAPEVQSILRNTLKKLNDFVFDYEFKKDFSSSDSDSEPVSTSHLNSNFIVKSHEPTARDLESVKKGLQKSLGIKNINKLTVGTVINIKPKKKA